MAKTASRNLTTGSPTRLVIGFLLPLLGGLLFQQLYNMVDTLVVGRFLGMDALAGVGSTSSVNFLVLGFCIGICNGFVIPVAQKFGEGDEAELRPLCGKQHPGSRLRRRGAHRGPRHCCARPRAALVNTRAQYFR